MDVRADFLVIGSGVAGLRAAISLAEAGDAVLLTKADPRESNTGYAQGGIAGVLSPEDRFENHIEDTIAAGGGLCDRAIVELVVREAPAQINDLIGWGTQFGTIEKRPGFDAYLGRIMSRPAALRAREIDDKAMAA